jgi:mutator protein MutT
VKESSYSAPLAIDVAAALIFRKGKLLITQRRLQDHLGGLWEFPGGKVEPGESFQDCLKREIREELGVEIDVGLEVDDITHAYKEKVVRLKFFRCTLLSGEPQPIACPNLAWISRHQLQSFPFPAADARLLLLLQERDELWTGV